MDAHSHHRWILGIALGIMFLFFLVIWKWVYPLSRDAVVIDQSCKLAVDVAEYTQVHQKQLPSSWSDFVKWYDEDIANHTQGQWTTNTLENFSTLDWGATISLELLEEKTWLHVKSPHYQFLEPVMNHLFIKKLKEELVSK